MLVLVALSIVALLAFASLAFDVGRFYSERRFLQNASDAAALAAANGLIRGETDSQAIDDADAILSRNFVADPTGRPPALPPATPVYDSGYAGDPSHLANGILINGGDVRVAIQNQVDWTFARAMGFTTNTIGARSEANLTGNLLPVAVRHFVGAPGPNPGVTSPCTATSYDFQDLVATSDTSCLGTDSDPSLRTDPSAGLPFDPTNPNNDPAHHGPITTIVGQGASPSNSASFRGFVVLDIRDFNSSTSNVFYNGVTAGTNASTLKNFEAAWIASGYPGPAFPPATSPPDPNDQIALTSGNSAGVIVASIGARYAPGNDVLCAVYSGTVMTIPDFTMPGPTQPLAIGTTQNLNGTVAMSLTKNASFTGTVTTSAFADANDSSGSYPSTMVSGLTFTPNPATPATTVTFATFATSGATAGLYTFWLQGHSASPYLTDHYVPVAVNIGGVARDFSSTLPVGGTLASVAATGDSTTLTFTLSTPNSSSTSFGGPVHLALQDGPATQTLGGPAGLGSATFSANDFTLGAGASQSVTLSLGSGTLAPGEYNMAIRASGTNSDKQPVTHLYPITLDVATAGTSNQYLDVMGFAVFTITAVDSNNVSGYAITPVIADMNDARLRYGQVAKLVPWT
ncbi:MAG: pilus assembly protein TadG-related protein [Candidatus Limnocylindrales bacterium]